MSRARVRIMMLRESHVLFTGTANAPCMEILLSMFAKIGRNLLISDRHCSTATFYNLQNMICSFREIKKRAKLTAQGIEPDMEKDGQTEKEEVRETEETIQGSCPANEEEGPEDEVRGFAKLIKPKIVPKYSYTSTDILGWYTMCILCVYMMLLKVVSHYDFSVLSMSAMGFQKTLDKWVGGCCDLDPVFWGFVYKFGP